MARSNVVWELASDLSHSGPLSSQHRHGNRGQGLLRGGGRGAEWEGVVSNEVGGVHPHISSSLIQYERVGHINWTVTYNTVADKERAVRWAYSQGQDESWQHAMRHVPLDLFLSNMTFILEWLFLLLFSPHFQLILRLLPLLFLAHRQTYDKCGSLIVRVCSAEADIVDWCQVDSFVDRCYHKSSVCVVPAEPSNEQSLCLTDHRLCFFFRLFCMILSSYMAPGSIVRYFSAQTNEAAVIVIFWALFFLLFLSHRFSLSSCSTHEPVLNVSPRVFESACVTEVLASDTRRIHP